MCICSPDVVELVRTNLAPDFPLFHGLLPVKSALLTTSAITYRNLLIHSISIYCGPGSFVDSFAVSPSWGQRKMLRALAHCAALNMDTQSATISSVRVMILNISLNICTRLLSRHPRNAEVKSYEQTELNLVLLISTDACLLAVHSEIFVFQLR